MIGGAAKLASALLTASTKSTGLRYSNELHMVGVRAIVASYGAVTAAAQEF